LKREIKGFVDHKYHPRTHVHGPQQQVAILPYKHTKKGIKVLLVTSRERKRWIAPKGWPMKNKTFAKAALIEAWEEAGLYKTRGKPLFLTKFPSTKRRRDESVLETEIILFVVEAKKTKKRYPEAKERKREWLRPKKAAKICGEPALVPILRNFDTRLEKALCEQ
jgi:8-oxo-dGTP pyrophosphatase MutT (NUDIX family)